jgi:c-di-GMP-related signal transduction protein
MNIFIDRQGVYDPHLEFVAYELLHRNKLSRYLSYKKNGLIL